MSSVNEVWRIAQDTPHYGADDLSGKGAEEVGGRWNRPGTALLYCSSSIALACLETLVHLAGNDRLPFNRYLVRIMLPPSAWRHRTRFESSENVGWDSGPQGVVSLSWGNAWAASAQTLIAEIPSVIIPEEANILINPRHRDAKRLRALKLRRWTYDPRLDRGQISAH
jgi:RES domain-containing protein